MTYLVIIDLLFFRYNINRKYQLQGEGYLPLIRKIITLGKNSYGITLPKTWIRFLEEKHRKIESVSMEVNWKLTIQPILKDGGNLQEKLNEEGEVT